MASQGEVVFAKGQTGDDGSDMWDDTALIKAYDNAVNTVKSQISGAAAAPSAEEGEAMDGGPVEDKEATAVGEDQAIAEKPRPKLKANKRRKKNKKNNARGKEWMAGELCQAVFTEDKQVYDAVIKSINKSRGVCVVHYCGYGNEEEQPLSALLPTNPHNTAENSFSESDQDSRPSSVASHAASYQRPNSSTPAAPTWPWPAPSTPTFPPFPSQMGSFPPMQMPSMYPPMPTFPGWPGTGLTPDLPTIPPPPPITDEDISNDKEALYSMLISWYMSGYHTGYYQGLKQGRKGSSSGENRPTALKASHPASTRNFNPKPQTKDSPQTDR